MSERPFPDPDAVRGLAGRLGALATALDECASGWAALTDGRWTGPAADAARERFRLLAHPLRSAATDLEGAAGALLVHAAVLDEAVRELAVAATTRQTWESRRTAEAAAAPTLDALVLGGAAPGPQLAGPGDALAAAIAAGAWRAVDESAFRTASVLADLADRAPQLRPFHPRSLGLSSAADRLGAVGPLRRTVRAVADDPEGWQTTFDGYVEEEAGSWADDGLTAAGMVPFAGVVPDLLHAGLDGARGRYGAMVDDAVAAVPGIGDAVAARRVGSRVGEVATQVARGARGYEKAQGAVSGLGTANEVLAGLVGSAAGRGGGAVPGSRVYAAALVGVVDPRAPAALRSMPSDDPAWALGTGHGTTWEPVPGHAPHSVLPGAAATLWRGTTEVEENGAQVTYAFTMTAAAGLVGAPVGVRRRPLPPDVGRPRRALRPGLRGAGP